jgi:pyruvate kinase
MTRRTKIVATLGPATDDPAVLVALVAAGVDVARINFSHGTSDEHLRRIAAFREASNQLGKVTAVLADLPGPKLRVLLPGPRPLLPGELIHFSLSAEPTAAGGIVITEPEALIDVHPGQRILLDDGRLQLEAQATTNGQLAAKVLVGGTLLPNKGLNLPDTPLTIPAVTERDRDAIAVAAKAEVDWLALSFVRGPDAANELRMIAAEFGLKVPVLAKLERPEAIRNSAAIIAAFDGVMVARGDLGVETPLEQLPMVQKQLITEARAHGKPVITATEMLDSMRYNPRPTRAEASDVANAICDGTDAVMLSGETAIGKYPVEAVAFMAHIAEETERHLEQVAHALPEPPTRPGDLLDSALALTTCRLAREIGATAIVVPTQSGRTARLLARYRPWARIVAPAPTPAVLRQMAVVWGLIPVPMRPLNPGDGRMIASVRDSFDAGALAVGDRVVVKAGHPLEGGPRLPTIRVMRVGEDGAAEEP